MDPEAEAWRVVAFIARVLAAALFGHGRAGLCVDGLASVFVDGLVAGEFCCGFAGGGVVDEVLPGGGGGDEGGGGCVVELSG